MLNFDDDDGPTFDNQIGKWLNVIETKYKKTTLTMCKFMMICESNSRVIDFK